MVEAARRKVASSPLIRRLIGKAEVYLVSFEILDNPSAKEGKSLPPNRYRGALVDSTHNRAFLAEGTFGANDLRVWETDVQPEPDEREFERAVAIVGEDPKLGPALRNGQLVPYRPMPPLAGGDLPVGAINRTVTVGLSPLSPEASHEIVGVDMIRRAVVRYPERAPETSRANGTTCGVPNAGQATTARGTAGQVSISILKGGETIWSFLAIRPAASSGTRASGLELRDVFYRGKKVLARAHAPILNVHYDGDACGPYRDWQWQEGNFVARGRDVLSGVRALTAPPETILDNDADNGSFRGLAYYANEDTVTLASEMEAGWYRYISYWIFGDNGTIKPRFGFDGVSDSCICAIHHHNVYWRFDFDVVTPQNNQISLVSGGTPQVQTAEARQLRSPGQTWLVRNTVSGEAYSIVPGLHDGTADSYAKGDLWLLLFKTGAELDDGVNCTSCGSTTSIQIDNFVGPEALTSASNVVVWYGAHFDHDVDAEENHDLLGPDLVPIGW